MKSAVKRNKRRILAVMLVICMVTSITMPGVWAQDLTSGSYDNNIVSSDPVQDAGSESEKEDSSTEVSDPEDSENEGEAGENGDSDINEPEDTDEIDDVDETNEIDESKNTDEDSETESGAPGELEDVDTPVNEEDGMEELDDFDGLFIVDLDEFNIPEPLILTRYDIVYDGNGMGGQYIDYGVAEDEAYTIRGSVGTGISNEILTLVGWNTEQDGSGTFYYPGDVISVEDYTILYAQWTMSRPQSLQAARTLLFSSVSETLEASTSYIVTYVWDSSANYTEHVPQNRTYYIKDALSLGIVLGDEYDKVVHAGWSTEPEAQGTIYNIGEAVNLTGNIKLYPFFVPTSSTTISVTYDGNGNGHSEDVIERGARYEIKSDSAAGISAPFPNWTFSRWGTMPDNSGQIYYPGDVEYFNQHVTLYAKYNPPANQEYAVNYYDDELNLISESFELAGEYVTLKTLNELGIVPEEGYVFEGWYDLISGNLYQEGWQVLVEGPLLLQTKWIYAGDLFSVTYDPNGGEGGTIVDNLMPNSTHTVLSDGVDGADVSRGGHEFIYWNTDENGEGITYKSGDSLVMTENVILYAIWEEDDDPAYWAYVTYEGNEGALEDGRTSYTEKVAKGTDYNLKDNTFINPTMKFTGWNAAADGNGREYGENELIAGISGDMTVYAQWTNDREYWADVTYYANNETGDSETFTVLKGSYDMAAADLFSYEGYLFDVWALEAEGELTAANSYAAGETITLDGDLEVYARWNDDPAYWAYVTYEGNEGALEDGRTSYTEKVAKGTDYNLKDNTFINPTMKFTGWNAAADGNGREYGENELIAGISGDMTVYAQWTNDREYWADVTYYANNETGDSETFTVLKGSYDMAAADLFSYEGYLFDVWALEAEGELTAANSYAAGETITLDGDLEVYARWNDDPAYWAYVTYEGNEGALEDGRTSYTEKVAKGTDYNLKDNTFINPTMKFTGWNAAADGNGREYGENELIAGISGDMTVYAQWTNDREYWADVTYYANNETGDSETFTVLKGSYDMAAADLFSYEGYLFDVWALEAEGELTAANSYAAGETITLDGDLEVYARWNDDPAYWAYVTYEGNEGALEDGRTSYTEKVAKGTDYNLKDNTFINPTMKFTGWNAAADGNGREYGENELIAGISGDMTVYAQWTNDREYWADVTYYANNETGDSETFTVLKGSYDMAAADLFSYEGYLFDVWALEAEGELTAANSYAAGETITLDGDLEVYARWNDDPAYWAYVTYEGNEGALEDGRTSYTEKVAKGTDYNLKDNTFINPTMKFTGWNAAADGNGREYGENELIAGISGDMTVYAQWTNDREYWADVTYYANNETGDSETFTVLKGSYDMAAADLFSYEGYLFDVWALEAEGELTAANSYAAGETITLDGDLEVYARWNDDPAYWAYVTYEGNEGALEDGRTSYTEKVAKGTDYNLKDNTFINPTMKFTGWNAAADGNGREYGENELIAGISGDMTVYAQWTNDREYWADVTYYANNETGDSETFTVLKGSYDMAAADLFSYEGYLFDVWALEAEGELTAANSYAAGETITLDGDLEVYARWNDDPAYWAYVTYEGNEGALEDGRTSYTEKVAKGTDYNLKDNTFINPTMKFTGWNAAADGNGREYGENELIAGISGDMTVYAQWTNDREYWADVTYYANNETGDSETFTVLKGSYDMAAADLFSYEGYLFDVWALEAEGELTAANSYAAGETITLDGDLEVYARWNDDPAYWAYVTYEGNEGALEDGRTSYTEKVAKGTDYNLKDNTFINPTMKFTGWNAAADGNGREYGENELIAGISGDMTVYAQWTNDREYWADVTYYANNETGDSETFTVLKGSYDMAAADLFSYEGYLFDVWALEAEGELTAANSYAAGETITLDGDLEVYARWNDDPAYWAYVTYEGNEGALEDGRTSYTEKVAKGTDYNLKDNTFINPTMKFTGWNAAADGNGREYGENELIAGISGDMTVYAQWTNDREYWADVTYYANNETGDSETFTVLKGSYDMAAADLFSYEGYLFDVWALEAEGELTAANSYAAGETITLDGDLEVYARWNDDPAYWAYVTYEGNEGALEDGRTSYTEKVAKGTDYNLKDNTFINPTMKFTGWNAAADGNGREYGENELIAGISGDMTVYAQWTNDREYWADVTYYANNETGDSETFTVLKGSYDMAAADLFSYEGYLFDVWALEAEGELTAANSYAAGETITLDGDLEVYARWNDDPAYWAYVTYEGNEGALEDGRTSYTEKVAKGTDYNLKDNTFINPTMKFTGWNAAADGNGREYGENELIAGISGDMTVYAQWTNDREYWADVTYYANNETGDSETFTVLKGSYDMAAADLFSYYGYKLTKWNTLAEGDGGISYTAGQNITLDGDLEVYARWEEDDNYWATFTYHGNEGTRVDEDGNTVDVKTERVLKGRNASLISNPFTRSSYVFEGWSMYASGQQNPMAAGTPIFVVTDMDFYAQWTPDSSSMVDVTYYANNETDESVTVRVMKGSYDMEGAGLFSYYGYKLTEWNTLAEGDGGISYTAGQNITLDGDLEVYARWEEDDNYWATLTYHGNEGTRVDEDGNTVDVKTERVLKGRNASLISNPFTRSSYVFEGWSMYASGQQNPMAAGTPIFVVTDMDFYAQWTPDSSSMVDVTYYANNETDESVTVRVMKGSYDMEGAGLFSYYGYKLTEWNTLAEGDGGISYTAGQNITLDGDLEVYARWEEDDNYWATLTYHGNEGTRVDEDGNTVDVKTERVLKGRNASLISNPFTRSSYVFEGWSMYASGQQNPMAAGTPMFIVTDMDFYAQWKPDDSIYKVKYDPNTDGDEYFGAVPTDNRDYSYDEYATILGLDPQNPLGRVGFRFLGWSTNRNADEPEIGYEIGASVQIKGDITLYAIWQEDTNLYYVEYDGNFATGGSVPLDGTGYRYNEEVTVKGNDGGLFKSNFEFKGWSFEQYNTAPYYEEGEQFRIQTDTTLYAAWRDVIVETVTVTYYPNGGDGDAQVDGPYSVGSGYTIASGDAVGITLNGYTVMSWSENPDGTGVKYEPGDRFTLTKDIELYANWKYLGQGYYMLYLDGNTGVGSKVFSGIAAGTSFVLQDASVYDIYKPNYVFTGWDTAEDGSGTRYSGDNDTIIIEGNTRLYAQWRYDGPVTYSVTYNAGGGYGGPSTDWNLAPGEEYVVKSPADVNISMPVMTFKHWVDMNDTTKEYKPGDKITMDRHIELKAIWGMN